MAGYLILPFEELNPKKIVNHNSVLKIEVVPISVPY
jgi:hypothetical protein